jgi:hypothetical protein
MKKITIYISTAFLVAIVIAVVVVLSNPLRSSNESIRTTMLKLTPIGTSMKDVVEVVEGNEKWEISSKRDYGYLLINGLPSFPYFSPIEESVYEYQHPIIGEKSMRVYLGEYRTIFIIGVSVFYAFDENSKLINIAVLKETDSL